MKKICQRHRRYASAPAGMTLPSATRRNDTADVLALHEGGVVVLDEAGEALARLDPVEQLAVEHGRLLRVTPLDLADVLVPAAQQRVRRAGRRELAVHLVERGAAVGRLARGGFDPRDELALALAEHVVA